VVASCIRGDRVHEQGGVFTLERSPVAGLGIEPRNTGL
jgi:hypothetical protein